MQTANTHLSLRACSSLSKMRSDFASLVLDISFSWINRRVWLLQWLLFSTNTSDSARQRVVSWEIHPPAWRSFTKSFKP
jgi:hypothetical protein